MKINNKASTPELLGTLIVVALLILVYVFFIRTTTLNAQEGMNQVYNCKNPLGWNGVCIPKADLCEEHHPDLKEWLNFEGINPCYDKSDETTKENKCCMLPYNPASKIYYIVTTTDTSLDLPPYQLSENNNKIYTGGAAASSNIEVNILVSNIYNTFFTNKPEKVQLIISPSTLSGTDTCVSGTETVTCTIKARYGSDMISECQLEDIKLRSGYCRFTFVGYSEKNNEKAKAFTDEIYVKVVPEAVPLDN